MNKQELINKIKKLEEENKEKEEIKKLTLKLKQLEDDNSKLKKFFKITFKIFLSSGKLFLKWGENNYKKKR